VDRDKAVWFAHRGAWLYGPPNKLIYAEVARRNVHAFFQGRQESEIVAADVKILRIESIKLQARQCRYVGRFANACRPASLIRSRTTPIFSRPAMTRSTLALA
jgi:hypothetical protein